MEFNNTTVHVNKDTHTHTHTYKVTTFQTAQIPDFSPTFF